MRPDRVILSSNEDPLYIEFVPWVIKAWKKLFGCKVTLALQSKNYEYIKKFNMVDDIIFFSEIDKIPSANLSKVIRLITATYYKNEVLLINDIDLLPLQTKYVNSLLEKRGHNNILLVGIDTYNGTVDEGKTPLGYLTGEGYLFKELINPNDLSWEDLVKSWIGQKVFDHKEDPASTIEHTNKDTFSDESLMRLLVSKWNKKDTNVKYVDRGFVVGVDSLDRSKWNLDPAKLKRGEYIESHMKRPFSKYKDELLKLIYYLGIA